MALWQFSNLNKYGTLRSRVMYLPDGKPFSHGPGFGKFVAVKRFKYPYEHPDACSCPRRCSNCRS